MTVAVLFIFYVLTLFIDPLGYLVTKRACAQDSGFFLKDNQRLVADGILIGEYYTESFCAVCLQGFQNGWFRFSEYFASHESKIEPRPGYYRYSIAEKDDVRCKYWEEAPIKGLGQTWLESNQCVAIQPIERPSAALKFDEYTTVKNDWFWLDLRRKERRITDVENDEIVARYTHYGYYTRAAKWLSSSTFAWQCDHPWGLGSTESFIRAVFDFGIGDR